MALASQNFTLPTASLPARLLLFVPTLHQILARWLLSTTLQSSVGSPARQGRRRLLRPLDWLDRGWLWPTATTGYAVSTLQFRGPTSDLSAVHKPWSRGERCLPSGENVFLKYGHLVLHTRSSQGCHVTSKTSIFSSVNDIDGDNDDEDEVSGRLTHGTQLRRPHDGANVTLNLCSSQ